jgi:ribosome biogenesis GTPase
LPGDRVNLSVIDDEKKIGSVDEIIERESELIRPAVANVNQLAAVIAAKSPSPDLCLLDKLLITARVKNIDS